ncbi:MAG TPA: hypothetical protein VHL79_23240 [Ramlibacter sp.]|jgi:hypothetical protein|nr:hypothetical protein [Ramlibacter sp.]
MEKVASMDKKSGQGRQVFLGRCAAAALLACAGIPALASEAAPLPVHMVLSESRTEPSVRVQVDATSLPRLDAQESGFQAPRVDVSLFPATSPRLGAVVGMSGFSPQQGPAIGLQPNKQSVDVGLRYSHRQVDVTAWRRMYAEQDASVVPHSLPVYGARVEMNLANAPRSGFAVDRGFLGLQLESGARISIKRKNGGPMIYYRNTF